MRKLSYLLSLLRSPQKVVQAFSYVVNDEVYWDAYARDWNTDPKRREPQYLGNEWKNEEVFLSLLRRFSVGFDHALEIGCGGGRITSKAVGLFKHVHACDISKEMLRQCQKSNRATNVSFHKLDGFTLKGLDDSSVDFVFSHDVFVHFSSLQVYPYFQEIKRVLQPGGMGIISFYNLARHFDLFKEMSLKYYQNRQFPPHMRVHFVTEELIRFVLADVGLQVVTFDKTNFLIVVFRK